MRILVTVDLLSTPIIKDEFYKGEQENAKSDKGDMRKTSKNKKFLFYWFHLELLGSVFRWLVSSSFARKSIVRRRSV